MLKKILIGLGSLLAALAIVVTLQPADFTVTRSATIAAPAASVFPLVNNFTKWEAWSPWAKLDPEMKSTYAGPETGEGAQYSWVGDGHVGEGRMTITESRANELVGIRLEFFKPFTATNQATFTFAPQGEGTEVTWSMIGKNNFMGKAIGLLMDMDEMCGSQFEEGLADIKRLAEAEVSPAPSGAPSPQIPGVAAQLP